MAKRTKQEQGNSDVRIFLQRGTKGRGVADDGRGIPDGSVLVSVRGSVMMPNGDVARPGDYFNPEAEGMSYERYQQLKSKRHITDLDPEYEMALIDDSPEKKNAPPIGSALPPSQREDIDDDEGGDEG